MAVNKITAKASLSRKEHVQNIECVRIMVKSTFNILYIFSLKIISINIIYVESTHI